MNKFRQNGTELLHLIPVENWFQCSISHIFWPIVFQLCIFCQISTELLPLIYVKNGFNSLSWAVFG